MNTTHTPFTLGSVSSGTLRAEDLLPVFAAIMRQFLTVNGHASLYVERAETIVRNEFYDMELADELVGMLMDGIQGYCPPFVYFGAHPGDGADFGFWVDHEALDDAFAMAQQPYALDGEFTLEETIVILANDGDNVTVMDMDRNVLWTTT